MPMTFILALVVTLICARAEHMGDTSYMSNAYAQLHRDWKDNLPASVYQAYQDSIAKESGEGEFPAELFCNLVAVITEYRDFSVLANEILAVVNSRGDVPEHTQTQLRATLKSTWCTISKSATEIMLEFATDADRKHPKTREYLDSLNKCRSVEHLAKPRPCNTIKEELMGRSCSDDTASPFALISTDESIEEKVVRHLACLRFKNSKPAEL